MNSIRISLLQKFYTFTYWKLPPLYVSIDKEKGDPMRKHLAIKILSLFIALLLIVGSAHAALSPQKANLAWERISKAAAQDRSYYYRRQKNLMPGFVFWRQLLCTCYNGLAENSRH